MKRIKAYCLRNNLTEAINLKGLISPAKSTVLVVLLVLNCSRWWSNKSHLNDEDLYGRNALAQNYFSSLQELCAVCTILHAGMRETLTEPSACTLTE